MKVTISPMVASPWMFSQVPTMMIGSTVKVVDVRVSTTASAHHDSTGICAFSRRSTIWRSSMTSFSSREKLCTSAILPSVSEARSARSE